MDALLALLEHLKEWRICLRRELGDFQTPLPLVKLVLDCLGRSGKQWARAIEPTCGYGNFVKGLLELAKPPREIQAFELQQDYLEEVGKLGYDGSSTRAIFKHADIFRLNFQRDLQWRESGPLLVVGNPPWVTNAELGVLGSDNLPMKANIKQLRGIAALTGESNFDIAEAIWLKLIRELAAEQPTIALLCKTAVARNVLQFAYDQQLPIADASLWLIDAKKWFNAAVDACLFCVQVGAGERRYEADIYPDLCAVESISTLGIVGNQLVNDMKSYRAVQSIDGSFPLAWRQGLKHDAASVMELTCDATGHLTNKLGESVIVESTHLYPLVKSSDLFNGPLDRPQKMVIVTQAALGEDTHALKYTAPLLWNYLMAHYETFARRKSSIYTRQPPFAIFGIGDYAFAPYKVAISGLHKTPRFRAIGPINGRPVMLDDTCYFIPCYTPTAAAFVASLLNDPACLDFIKAIVFLDAKRPITKKLLQRIDLKALFTRVNKDALALRMRQTLTEMGENAEVMPWSSIDVFLAAYAERSGSDYVHVPEPQVRSATQLSWIG